MEREQSNNTGSSGSITAGFERVRQAVKDAMEPTSGPATTCNTGFSIYLEFHPRENMPITLRAQAQKLMLDVDKMMLETDILEQASGASQCSEGHRALMYAKGVGAKDASRLGMRKRLVYA